MPTTEELITGLQARILEIEKILDDLKGRPATPDRATEIKSLKDEISELRRELSDLKPKKGTPPADPKGDEGDVSLGHFSGD